MNFNLENPCQGLDIKNRSDVQKFFELETTHMPSYGYAHNANIALQRSRACAQIKRFGYIGKCHPVVPFLAISYHDNFISTRDIPVIIDYDSFENWGLFITSCFFSAWKMIYPDECDTTAFLIKLDSCFVTNELYVMVHEIDRWLQNRYCKRPITSLTFLDFFISDLADVDKTHVALIKNFATHRAYAQQYNMKFTEYKPSILAATAILYSCGIFYKDDYDFFEASIFESEYLDTTSLRQALGVQKPRVVNIEPATLKKIRDILGDLSNDFPTTPPRFTESNTINPIASVEAAPTAPAAEDSDEERKPEVSSSITPALPLDDADLPPKKRRFGF